VFSGESFSAFTQSQNTNVLIEFRKILEVGLASLAAAKATNEDLARMARTLQDHQHALDTSSIVYYADIAFHDVIAEASKNPIAILALKTISGPLEEQRRKSDTVPNAGTEALEEHWRIYKAICAKNSVKARSAMRAHLGTAERHWRIANAGASEPPPNAGQPAYESSRVLGSAKAPGVAQIVSNVRTS
jgi:GntR family transcriptional repressor for pyruvate dehydrogenase complex